MATPTQFKCNHCGGSMDPKSVSKYGGCLSVLGVIMALPGILALILALLMIVGAVAAPTQKPTAGTTAEQEAVAKVAVTGFFGLGAGALIFVGAPSLAIGVFLNLRRHVWKCAGCGSFVERL